MILLALLRLDYEAYGVSIAKAIEESSEREVVLGSVYITFDRLEGKGSLAPTSVNPRRYAADERRPTFRLLPKVCGRCGTRSGR